MPKTQEQDLGVALQAHRDSLQRSDTGVAERVDPRLVSTLDRLSRGAGVFAVMLGALVLTGWVFDIALLQSVAPGWATMKANTALAFVLAGVALWVLQAAVNRPGARLLAGACAALVAATGLATLSQDLAGWNLGIDQMLFKDTAPAVQAGSPGRMAPATAFNFLLLGGALLFLAFPTRRRQGLAVPLALGSLIVSGLAAIGYAYGVPSLYRVSVYSSMAAHTSLAFIVLSLAVLFACAHRGWAPLLVSRGVGGTMLRDVWLPASVLVILLGALRLRGEQSGIFGTEFGLALMVVAMIAVLSVLLWRSATLLDKADAEGERDAVARSELAAIVDTSSDAIISCTPGGIVLSWNASAEKMLGYTTAEMIGRNVSVIAPPDRQHETQHHAWLLQHGKSVPTFETIRIARDGRPVDAQMSLSATREAAGGITQIAYIFRDVTERKRNEEAARESQRRLATLMDNLPGMAYRCRNDPQWTVEFISDGCLDVTGYRADEFLENKVTSFGAIMHPDDAQPIWEKCQANLAAQQPCRSEYRIIHRNGEIRWVWDQARGIYSGSGELLFIEGMITDITERKLAATTLRESEERFRATFEQAAVGIAHVAPDGRWLRVNQKLCDIVGYSREELLEKTFQDITHPDDLDADLGQVRRMLRREINRYSMEKRYFRKSGEVVWINLTVSLLWKPSGEPDYFISVVEDISKRKQSDAARAELAAIVEGSNDAIVGRSLGGTVTSWNAAAERLLGWSGDEVIGQPIAKILLPERRDRTASNNERLLSDETITPSETRRITKDGRVVDVLSSVSAVRDANGKIIGAAMIIHDITDLKKAQLELQRRADLARLIESLARAANEAATPEEALRTCVARICDYGGWALGRAGTFASGQRLGAPQSSVWHCLQPKHFAEFIDISNRYTYTGRPSGQFVSEALRERRPAWVSDFSTTPDFGRLAEAVKCGIRGGFVFPVVVGDEPLAFLEFFAGEVREPDASFLEAINSISAQLARVIERWRTLDEARANEQKLSGILGALHEVVWSMDARSGRILYLNAAAKRLTRRSVTDFLANKRTWRRMIHPDDRARVRSDVRALLEKDELTHEFRIVLADGEVRVLENRARVVRDARSEPQRIDGTINDITERRRAEDGQSRLAAIVENSNDAIIGRALDGTITSWNAGAERLLGYSAGEAIGQRITFMLPPGQHGHIAEISEKVLRGEAITPHETRRKTKDGRVIVVMSSISPLRDGDGKVVGASQILHDITALKQAEEAQARLAAIVEHSGDAIISRGLDRTILTWNPAAERLFGWTAREAIGQDIRLIVPPERVGENTRNRERVHRGLVVPEFDTVRMAKDGRRIEVSLSQSPVKNERGEVTAVSLMFRDITERKRADAERARLAAIVESTSDAVISRGMDGNVLSWNTAAERLFGWSAKEAIGQPIKSLIVPLEHRGALRPLIERVMRGEAVPAIEHTQLRKDGARVDVSITFSAVRDAQGNIIAVAGILRDIRPQKAAEREIKHKAQLTQLLEGLARAVNEADTPEAAMQACVARICDYGGWNLGRAGIFGQGQFKGVPHSSIWHCPQSARFEEFMRTSNGFDHGVPSGRFVSAALREMKPVWVSDFSTMPGPGRLADAGQSGIHAGFVFPVIVGNEVAAFLEFFADDVREPDVPFLEAIATINSQLARVIERQRAESVLKESEERFRATFEQAGVGMALRGIDPRNSRWLRVNQKLCDILGYTREELLQLTSVDVTPPEDRDAAIDYNNQLQRGEIASYTREKRYLRKDGSIMWANISLAAVRGPDGRPTHVISVIEDITERKQTAERVDFLAQYDVVTGLPNRRLFADRLTLAMARDKRLGAMTALLLLDLDRFKQINETLGHSAGDEALQRVTTRLRECLREVDTIARLGGDEFVVILESVAETAQALRVAEKIMGAMAEPIALKGEEVFITASIGIALYPADADSVDKLTECAELAMYQAKQEGRNTVQLYTPDRGSRRAADLGMDSRLRRALERDELLLHFQPKVDVRTGAITGAEALVRWHNPDLGLVSPADFIPLAEETGLIVPIGEWVLHTACMQASAWQRQGHPLSVAVNLSARQFRQNDLCETVERALADSALDAGRLELEITESMIMHRPEQTIATLQRLHDIGVKLSVDDFGTGYSSLSYLKRFPVHKLKIDQSFVRELHKSADDAAIVRAVIALAASLNLKTVAEGVETEQQLIYLAGLHCDEYQGYYFSKPLPAAEFLELLRARAATAPASPIRHTEKAARSRLPQARRRNGRKESRQ